MVGKKESGGKYINTSSLLKPAGGFFLLAFLTLLCSACGQCALRCDSLMAGAESIAELSS